MALNIKNERTVALAREVAAITGESLTDAVYFALDARLAALRASERTKPEQLEQLWEEIQHNARGLGRYDEGFTTDDLYDPDTGLPA